MGLIETEYPSGFNAMGRPIPNFRKSAALADMRDMVPHITTTDAMFVIDRCAMALERDDPYRAFEIAQEKLNLIGAYRLVANLLAAAKKED